MSDAIFILDVSKICMMQSEEPLCTAISITGPYSEETEKEI